MRKFKHNIKNHTIGEQGQFSKIEEEYIELKDVDEQKDWLFQVIEASDLLYAIRSYSHKQLRLPLFVLYFFALIRRPYKWFRKKESIK